VIGRDVLMSDPAGPVIDGEDAFRKAVRVHLQSLCAFPLSGWEPYRVRSGEIHYGTNAIRHPAHPARWKSALTTW
jgi:hypothetical protein